MLIALLGIIGLLVGSFLNVVIWRWPREEEFVQKRSHCVHCGHTLAWFDLLPLASWLWVRGRCRYCKKKISPLYPIVESMNSLAWMYIGWLATTGYHLGGIGWIDGITWRGFVGLLCALAVISTLIVIWWIDWLHQLIPDGASILLGCLGLVCGVLDGNWGEKLLWGVIAGLFFVGLYVITRGKGMGLGDVKLAGAMGLLLGWLTPLSLVTSFWSGAAVGISLLLLKRAKFGMPIAFGPFMVLGVVVAMFYGESIVEWYWMTVWIMGM